MTSKLSNSTPNKIRSQALDKNFLLLLTDSNMSNQNPYVRRLKEKLYNINSSEKPKNSKITLTLSELANKAKDVRKTFKDEDLARFNFS